MPFSQLSTDERQEICRMWAEKAGLARLARRGQGFSGGQDSIMPVTSALGGCTARSVKSAPSPDP